MATTRSTSTSSSSSSSGGTLPRGLATTRRTSAMSPLPLLLTLTLTLTLGSLGVVEARTFPTEVAKLLALKAELETRGLGYLLDSWTCPPEGECDPCGPTAGNGDSWGAWHYIACRQVPPGERAAAALRQAAVEADPVYAYSSPPGGSGSGDVSGSGPGQRRLLAAGEYADAKPTNVWGLVTNIHLSDLAIEGTLESMQGVLCPFRHLRELDMDGGRLRGPIPGWLGTCFPHLLELDLSHNQLSGSIPGGIWSGLANLEQAKLEDNRLTGSIPRELASLGNLRVLWLEENDLIGSVPKAFGASNALRRILSLNLEDNPSLCGDLPRGLGVDWRWQLDNQGGTSRDWFGFCEKDPCGVFASGGTDIGKRCPATAPGQQQPVSCGMRFDQCGGTVAVVLQSSPDNPYGGDTDANITIDVPFAGAQCCRRGLRCAEMERDDEAGTSYSKCVADPNWELPALKTKVPAEILREYRELNDAEDVECAAPWTQCGGTASYLGATCCTGAAPCVRSSPYYSQCDPDACAGAWQQCGGYRHQGPQCCRAGLECVMHNGGYHQCVVAETTLDMTRYEREKESSKLRPLEEGAGGDEPTPQDWEQSRRPLGDDEAGRPGDAVVIGNGSCTPPWGQCGGFFFEPFLRGPARLPCCPSPGDDVSDKSVSGTRCVRKNDWYSACEECVNTWAQCGGLDYSRGGCCRDVRDACVKVDDFFWQCTPDPV